NAPSRIFFAAAGAKKIRDGAFSRATGRSGILCAGMRVLTGALLACALGACVDAPADDPIGAAELTLGGSAGIPVLPSPSGTGVLSPWGGTDPTRWRPEAILANGASAAMNDAW